MKKTPAKTKGPASDELSSEYSFDYRKARPNRFAAEMAKGARVVVLDPDVAERFPTAESVNAVLRALIKTMPAKAAGKPSARVS